MNAREQAASILQDLLKVQTSTQAHYSTVPTEALIDVLENTIIASALKLPSTGCNFEEVEHSFIIQALIAAKGNQTQAAKLLCMTRDQIRYRMRRFGIPSRFGMPKAE